MVARIGVGGIFFANGWTKLEDGLNTTGAKFLAQGAPAPRAWATVTMLTELIGGALLIAGLIVSVMGLILFAEALAVFLIAPPLNPISTNELVLLGVAALLLAVVGPGRISVDHLVVIRRRESAAANEFAAETEADEVIAALRDPDSPGFRPPARPKAGSSGASGSSSSGSSSDSGGSSSSGGSTGGKSSGARSSSSRSESGPETSALEDTAPHARPRRPGTDPGDEPTPSTASGDTLVAGRKKPPARGRRTTPDE
ncbi:DoxX family protein [Nonomuraea aurantiaca]|uniref:DoxX family protein n=1 Tax=Nonomuraea aurantiaca TaxID=2878562 RepID=UPI001CD9402E|nr:DoxX family protein [Nonomuraea aurantiaca]MCA2219807.1 DoxX family protein [Nonomuraea aurantiaca]